MNIFQFCFFFYGIRARFNTLVFPFFFFATADHYGGTTTLEQQSIFLAPFKSYRYGAYLKAS
jgi:hypothetical protein